MAPPAATAGRVGTGRPHRPAMARPAASPRPPARRASTEAGGSMSPEAAISRGVLSHAVKDRLLERIVAGTYAPGARIVETRVARELGTSQAPVREALRDLEALGVVEI